MSQEMVWYLKKFNLFKGMGDSEIDKVAAMIKSDSVKRNDSLFLQGEHMRWIYFLKEGLIRLESISANGKVVPIDLLYPGEVFGALDFEENGDSAIQAICLTDSLLCRMTREQFSMMLKSHSEMVFAVNKLLGLRIRRIEVAIQDLIFLDIPARISKLLYRLAASDGERHPMGTRINIRLTHQDVADLVGATREMVSVSIGKLENERILMQDKRHFVIPNLKRLQKRFTDEMDL